MASSFKAYMAGVGTVAVAVVLGFGGGVIIAQRFGSDTAVQEQSKIAKAKQDAKQAEAPKQGDPPQLTLSQPEPAQSPAQQPTSQSQDDASPTEPSAAPVVVEHSPDAAQQSQEVTAPPSQPNQRETIRDIKAPQRAVTSAEERSPTSSDEVSATTPPPQQAASADRERTEPVPARKKETRQQKRKERKDGAKDVAKRDVRQDAANRSRAKETDGYAARDDDEEFVETEPGLKPRPRIGERRAAREVIEEVEIDGPREDRRPMGLPPFFGLFGR